MLKNITKIKKERIDKYRQRGIIETEALLKALSEGIFGGSGIRCIRRRMFSKRGKASCCQKNL